MSEETPGTKLELISIEVRRQQKRYYNSLRGVIFFTLIMLVFFSMYLTLIVYKIREVATPTTIALLIAGELRDEASSDKSRLISDDFRLLSRETAHGAVSIIPLLSGPVAEQKMRTVLSEKNLSEAEKFSETLSSGKAYQELLEELLRKPGKTPLTPEEKNRYTVKILKEIHQQNIPMKHFLHKVTPGFTGNLLKKFREKPSAARTGAENSFYDFILCTLYFSENKRYRDSKYHFLFDLYLPVLQELGFPEEPGKNSFQNNTKNNPVRKAQPAKK